MSILVMKNECFEKIKYQKFVSRYMSKYSIIVAHSCPKTVTKSCSIFFGVEFLKIDQILDNNL